MKISVVGLGVEGQKATISLLKRDYDVYSSDINKDIDLSLLQSSGFDENINLDLEVGSHNLDKIFKSDAVSVSPSLFNKKICKDIIERDIFISDIFTKHKSVKTIAVTGTNGKTTTTHMIYEILKNNGYKVAIGGNGGGGFSGYNELLLDANENDYDYMVIEVCDMTLAFCSYVFDIDIVVVTNIGYDHMDVHGSIEQYTQEVAEFIKDKPAILNCNDENLVKIKDESSNPLLFNIYDGDLNLFGKFNLKNADAAYMTCQYLGINTDEIKKSLAEFEAVKGRTKKIIYNTNEVITGKTDNVDALKAVLDEERFDILIIGTPRKYETCRYNILDYIKSYKPDTLIIFPGLEDTTYDYIEYLNNIGYNKDMMVLKNIDDIIRYINSKQNSKIFIGGNGQEKITKITSMLEDEL
ncbi:MAG: Mur ligase family protein [Methanosphaera sp.]|uniref:Mur ligase family protein n=1 Tax=Methanosphaera sp. TaxID=2666342 RepID=UPI0025FADA6D|nr:Mur ligase family protein [Methanosphaera sp.]MCI5867391.1 Mur ligase family protein [Methanosphaera sp.]MDY3955790.1 Mur ligase family protein [Methanosphaera sp.]